MEVQNKNGFTRITRHNRKTRVCFALLSSLVFFLLFTSFAIALDCGCDSCHGNPPLYDNVFGGPSGLATPPTGSTTSGAHSFRGQAASPGHNANCQNCHYGGMPITTMCGNNKIQIGFDLFGYSGGGTGYDGQVLNAPFSYEGTNGTTVTTGGTKVCSNIYCHGDGTSVSTGIVTLSSSPAWDYGQRLPCNYCHGNTTYTDWRKAAPLYAQDNPKSNSHARHIDLTCNYCHYSLTHDGITITDTTKNANGVYDVLPDPAALFNGSTPVSFAYTYDRGGGTCTNISCHITRGLGLSATWGNALIGVNSAFKSGTNCYEILFYNVSGSGGTAPYTYFWEFGDGTTSTEQNPAHVFPTGATYYVKLTVRDAKNHPGVKYHTVIPKAANVAPVANFTVSIYGWTVTLTDLSYDTDYNYCGHTGPGQIDIMWGDTYAGNPRTKEAINLTNQPSNKVYTHTYSTQAALPNAQLFDNITDNSNSKVPKYMSIAVPSTYTIKGRVANASGVGLANAYIYLRTTSGGVPNFGTTTVYTDSNGNYTISNTAVEGVCYIVKQPVSAGYTFTPGDQTVCSADSNVNWTSSP